LLLNDKYGNSFPILIEYKGYKDKLVCLNSDNQVDNTKANNEPNFTNIKRFAVNGAVHYANALLHHTSYAKNGYQRFSSPVMTKKSKRLKQLLISNYLKNKYPQGRSPICTNLNV